ncbi:MAG: hypothetical protein JKY94_17840 [Rhodobacteraceae bacterium]|nr:hypothetical protein [Paracoccaceae bacterium]
MSVRFKQKSPDAISQLAKRYGKGADIALGWPTGTDSVGLKYPDGTSVLMVAFWNNFGTKGIPRRDFMTAGGRLALEKTSPIARKGMKKINAGTLTVEQLYDQIGAVGAFQIGQAAVDLKTPANAQSTIDAKGGKANPLVETGLMTQSSTWSVRKK